MLKFELKKFIGLIGVNNRLMQLFYDKAEEAGLQPTFDVYHILSGNEVPTTAEIEIMKQIFEFNVKGTVLEKDYDTADTDFASKIHELNKKRRSYNDKGYFKN